MYWTLKLTSQLEDAPWSAIREELIYYAKRVGLPSAITQTLDDLEDDEKVYESIEDLWPEYPTKGDFLFDEGK
ncbi:unnamed protein product [Cunninghamella echinulata]